MRLRAPAAAANYPATQSDTNSVVALDPDDGSMRWHYPWTPHDVRDFDGVTDYILFEQDGRKLLAHFDRSGYLFILDRTDGKLVRAVRFAQQVDWGTIDETTGRQIRTWRSEHPVVSSLFVFALP